MHKNKFMNWTVNNIDIDMCVKNKNKCNSTVKFSKYATILHSCPLRFRRMTFHQKSEGKKHSSLEVWRN